MPRNIASHVAVLLALLVSQALAGEVGKVHVIQMDPDLPVAGMAGPDVEIHRIGEKISGDKTFDPKLRDEVFKRAGLRAELKGYDSFARDLLFQRARAQPLTKLVKLYPKISARSLERLKKAQQEVQ